MLLVALGGFTACTSSKPEIRVPAAAGKKTVAVVAVDQRTASASKPVAPAQLGEVGGAYGRPFVLLTENQIPVSQTVTEHLTTGFRAGGWRTRAAAAEPASREEAFQTLRGSGADRLVIVTLRDWQSYTLASTDFRFDLEFSVLDASGRVLAAERFQGSQNLGYPKFGRLSETIRQSIEEESIRVFTAALQKPALVAALQ